jgi:hypothetical protein
VSNSFAVTLRWDLSVIPGHCCTAACAVACVVAGVACQETGRGNRTIVERGGDGVDKKSITSVTSITSIYTKRSKAETVVISSVICWHGSIRSS